METANRLSETGALGATDRRRQPRYRISANVEMSYDRGTVPATATNISNNGIEVRSSIDVHHDAQVRISIGIPDEAILYGTAIWSLCTPVKDVEAYRIGFAVYGIFHKGTVHSDPSSIGGIIHKVVTEYG